MKTTTRFLRAAALAATVLLATACGTGNVKKTDTGGKGVSVEDRAVQRWQHLIAKRAGDAYEYLTPGYRATHPKEPYAASMSNRPVQWKEVQFKKKDCADEDTCVVHLMIIYDLKMSSAMPAPVQGLSGQTENWIRIKGVWYYLPEQ